MKHTAGKGCKEQVLRVEKFILKEKTMLGDSDMDIVSSDVKLPDVLHQFVRGLCNHSIIFAIEAQVFAQPKQRIQYVRGLSNLSRAVCGKHS